MGDRKAAIDFYNQGVSAVNDLNNPQRLPHAYTLFSSACVVDPTYGMGWYQCGNNNFDLQMFHASIANWRRALQGDLPNEERSKVLCNLGWGFYCVGRIDEALACFEQAITHDANDAVAWCRMSIAHGILDHSLTSVECALRAHELAPDDATIEMALAFALLLDGQYQQGFKHFEARFRYRLKNFLQYPYPKWNGEPGKTVHLVADQGLGDTLSFSRFVEAASKRAKYIHAAVQPELLHLFSNAFMHLPNVNLIPQPCNLPPADAWSTFVSLPSDLGLTDQEIIDAPHIACPDFDTPIGSHPQMWKISDRKLHIGIAWTGSPLNDIDKHRNIPLQHFLELYDVPGIQLYSLQVGEKAGEMRDQGCAALIQDLTPYIRTVVDTVGALKHLDLLITCESALGHICALAQKECIIPYSHLGRDYRAGLTGKAKLWTPHHAFIRQGPDQDWRPVFAQIKTILRDKIDAS